MFTAAKISDGDGYLDRHLVANDYYNEHESVTGEWLGRGSERLGIEGASISAGDKAFAAFRRNRLPNGSKMTPRDKEDRVRFISFQCSAPKSVSVLAVTAGDARLIEAHRSAVTVAFREMESFAACQCNSATERRTRFTGNLIAARFTHTASRALDPQVHDHLVLVAGTFDTTVGGWRALTEYEIFKAVRYLGKVYQNELAQRCRDLGYELRPGVDERRRTTGFEIVGVADETLKLFSKRRAQVERAIGWFEQKHGRAPTRAEIQVMVNQTRDSKLDEISTPEVIRKQREQLGETETLKLDALKFAAISRAKSACVPEFPGRERDALREAVTHLYERVCVESGHAVMAEALNRNLGRLSLSALKHVMTGPELVAVGRGDGDIAKERFVTPTGLRRERWILSLAREDKGVFFPLAPEGSISEMLSDEQREVVKTLLSCEDRIASLRGAAGVGKTTVLAEVDRKLRDAGRVVAHCAPTASAADTLRKDGLIGAVTLASFLENAPRNPMPAGSVLIVDESGLASLRDGAEVLRLAAERDWRVIFVGDTRQHSSVDAGDFLRLVEDRCGVHRVELTQIRRQTEKDYRHAIRLMSTGDAKAGLQRLDGMGCMRESGPDYLQNAAADYLAAQCEAPEKTLLCVTPTWAENHTLTGAIRQKLRDTGKLGLGETVRTHEPLSWTGREKQDVSRYAPGLVVVFDRREGGFTKGESAIVTRTTDTTVFIRTKAGAEARLPLKRGGFDVCEPRDVEIAVGDTILLRANDNARGLKNGMLLKVADVSQGRIITMEGFKIDTRDYGRFSHGYVVTSYKSQGKTSDRVIVAAARLDAKTAYVACSRGRESCVVHTPDKRSLMKSVPDGNRPLAVEQPGFLAAAKRLELVNTPGEDALRARLCVSWASTVAWMKGIGHNRSVDARAQGDDPYEKQHAL